MAIMTKLCHNWDKKLCQANNLRRSCWTCDESPSQLETKIHGNIDEYNISKPNLRHTCCICDEYSWKIATKLRRYRNGCGKIVKYVRRTCIDIATMNLGFNFFFYMKYGIPYYNVIWYTILQCNMVMPYYNVIW